MATIFSRIIRGEIPSYKVAEDKDHFAFLDIDPVVEGHTLVIPKMEIDYLFDLEQDQLRSLMTFSQEIARVIDQTLNPIRTGVVVQGLEVPHAHIHLIPLYQRTQSMSLSQSTDVSKARMKEIAGDLFAEFKKRGGE